MQKTDFYRTLVTLGMYLLIISLLVVYALLVCRSSTGFFSVFWTCQVVLIGNQALALVLEKEGRVFVFPSVKTAYWSYVKGMLVLATLFYWRSALSEDGLLYGVKDDAWALLIGLSITVAANVGLFGTALAGYPKSFKIQSFVLIALLPLTLQFILIEQCYDEWR